MVALAEQRDDGDTAVATDDGDVLVLGVGVLDLADEARGTDDIEGGDTENPAECGSVYCNTTSTIRPTSWG